MARELVCQVGLTLKASLDERNSSAWRIRFPAPEYVCRAGREAEPAVDTVGHKGGVWRVLWIECRTDRGHGRNGQRLLPLPRGGCLQLEGSWLRELVPRSAPAAVPLCRNKNTRSRSDNDV